MRKQAVLKPKQRAAGSKLAAGKNSTHILTHKKWENIVVIPSELICPSYKPFP